MELWQNDGVKYSLQVWLCGNHFINYIYNASLDFYMKNYASKWIMQRLTAVILIPLTFWFVYQCVILSNYEYDQIKSFFYSKINASLFFILIIAMLYHAKLGNETIVEDYVTSHNLKKITKLTISALTYIFMILTTISLFFILIMSMLYHAKLGNETIVEDYVTSYNLKKITKFTISTLTYLTMILTTISLFNIISS